MPQRPKAHQLEDRSRTNFQLRLPPEWVFRDKNKDYGIDGEVEVFSEGGSATGQIFLIQLKSRAKANKECSYSLALKIEQILYYRKISLPTLIVLWVEQDKKLYIKWSNSIDTSRAKPGAKNISIRFTKQDEWGSQTASLLQQHVSNVLLLNSTPISLPLRIGLVLAENSDLGMSRRKMVRAIETTKNNQQLFTVQPDDEALISLRIEKSTATVSVNNSSGLVIHLKNHKHKKAFTNELLSHLAYCTAVSLSQFNQLATAGHLLSFVTGEVPSLYRNFNISHVCRVLIEANKIDELFGILEQLEDDVDDLSNTLLNTFSYGRAYGVDKKQSAKAFQNFLERRLSKAEKKGDRCKIGIAHYNLGNFFRSRLQFSNAAHHYKSALRHRQKYRAAAYFYEEIGGVLYESRHYKCARDFYSHSLSIEYSTACEEKLADSLAYCGQYEDALNTYGRLIKTPGHDVDAVFKFHVLAIETLIGLTQIRNQTREPSKCMNFGNINRNTSESDLYASIQDAVRIDALNGFLWVNAGFSFSALGNNEKSATSFLLCCLSQPSDVEAWKFLIVHSMLGEETINWIETFLEAAYQFNGKRFLDEMETISAVFTNEESAEKLLEIFDEIIRKVDLRNAGSDKKMMRFHFKDNETEIVDIE